MLSRDKIGPSAARRGRRAVWSLAAELHGEGLTARTSIWLGPERVEEGLDEFFARLAESADWETRSWEGMEGGLEVHCASDRVSTVQARIVLRHLSGADWVAEETVPIDFGQLSELASELRRLLAVSEK